MAIYEEKKPLIGRSIILLIFAFLVIYSPFQLGEWELRWDEDQYAAIASEMNLTHPYTIAHGEQVPMVAPLFPWLTALLHRTGLSFEYCMRLIAIASLAGLIILTWEAGKRAKDLQTAVVAAAMLCSSIIIIEKATDGYPNLTGLLFLFSAWLAWFTFGVSKGRWNSAWIISFLLCAMAFYTINWFAIVLFIVPLIFMRRPMTIWSKLAKPGFAIGVLLLLFFISIWIIPRLLLADKIPFKDLDLSIDTPTEYLMHLIKFPFAICSRYFPWIFLAWPAFCVAYFPLDKNPIFTRFLRTIVISLFFLLWLSPSIDAIDFIYIAPPLSILCGMHYWLLVRRHGHALHLLFRYCLYAVMLVSAGIILFYILPDSILEQLPYITQKQIDSRAGNTFIGLLQAALALLVTLTIVRIPTTKIPVYAHVLLICVAGALCLWATNIHLRKQSKPKTTLGHELKELLQAELKIPEDQELPKDLTVFQGPDIKGFYAPCIYMGARVKKIHKLSDLPEEVETVYMITTTFPAFAKREWDYLTPTEQPITYKKETLYILRGVKINDKDKNEGPDNSIK